MGVEIGWTLAPSILGDRAAPSFLLHHPEASILVLTVQDVPWPLLQGPKKQDEGVGGRKQLLEAFCLHPIGQTWAYSSTCVPKV